MEMTVGRPSFVLFALALLLVCGRGYAQSAAPVGAIDFAAPQPVIDLGPTLSRERLSEPGDPRGSWFSIGIQNNQPVPVSRVLTAFSPAGLALGFEQFPARPAIAQVIPSDPAAIVESAPAFGTNAFRVLLPAHRNATLTLHLENAAARQPVLAWTEPALIANNRQTSVLDGLIWGLLTSAVIVSSASAAISSRVLASWSGLFLFSVLMADLTSSGFLDSTALVRLSGPYGLFALWTALALSAAIRVIDYVAPFEAFWRPADRWRDRVALAVIGVGVVAYAGAPLAGVLVRVLALCGAAAAAGYLSHCGRIGVAAARRLAPAATIFALVTAAAGFNTLGLFGVNLTASAALSGFAAAGALLVAVASTIPAEHSIGRLRDLLEAHRHDDLQATTTDEAIEREWESAALAAAQQGVFDLDLESGNLSLSSQAATVLGFPPSPIELKAEVWTGRVVSDDWDFLRETIISNRGRAKTPFRVEFRVKAGRRQTWCELRAIITEKVDSAEHCLGLIADVTARKTAEMARKQLAGALTA
ncbi:MAG TPA: PAS domain-containing protein [Micropepsaceae bacterium]|nr:PAS domain-containing protein [Micropepsaceae bacterium]